MCMRSLPTCMPVDHIRASLGRPEEGASSFGTGGRAIRRMLQTEPGPSYKSLVWVFSQLPSLRKWVNFLILSQLQNCTNVCYILRKIFLRILAHRKRIRVIKFPKCFILNRIMPSHNPHSGKDTGPKETFFVPL